MAADYKALDVAKWIVANIDREAGDSITHLKLQKLLYYVQAWSLTLHEEPMFDEDFQAWAHGPVVESVFHEYKQHQWDALPPPDNVPKLKKADAQHVIDVLSLYGNLSAKKLENMTHREDPWIIARGDLSDEARSNAVIKKSSIKKYYKKLLAELEDDEKVVQ